MEVAAVDERHVHTGATELACSVEPAKSAADDDGAVARPGPHFSSTPCIGGNVCVASGGAGAGGGGSVHSSTRKSSLVGDGSGLAVLSTSTPVVLPGDLDFVRRTVWWTCRLSCRSGRRQLSRD